MKTAMHMPRLFSLKVATESSINASTKIQVLISLAAVHASFMQELSQTDLQVLHPRRASTSLRRPFSTADRRIQLQPAGRADIHRNVADMARTDAEGEAACAVQQEDVPDWEACGDPRATADPPLPGGLHRCHRHCVQPERLLCMYYRRVCDRRPNVSTISASMRHLLARPISCLCTPRMPFHPMCQPHDLSPL